MGWVPKGRSIEERIGKDQRHPKGQIRRLLQSLLRFFPKGKVNTTHGILVLEGCHDAVRKQHERCRVDTTSHRDGEG